MKVETSNWIEMIKSLVTLSYSIVPLKRWNFDYFFGVRRSLNANFLWTLIRAINEFLFEIGSFNVQQNLANSYAKFTLQVLDRQTHYFRQALKMKRHIAAESSFYRQSGQLVDLQQNL